MASWKTSSIGDFPTYTHEVQHGSPDNQRRFLLETFIFRFHVKLSGCIQQLMKEFFSHVWGCLWYASGVCWCSLRKTVFQDKRSKSRCTFWSQSFALRYFFGITHYNICDYHSERYGLQKHPMKLDWIQYINIYLLRWDMACIIF